MNFEFAKGVFQQPALASTKESPDLDHEMGAGPTKFDFAQEVFQQPALTSTKESPGLDQEMGAGIVPPKLPVFDSNAKCVE
jgi:hypothetical protein